MSEALVCLLGGRGRVDVVAHAACAVSVGGVAEHRTAVRIAGVLQDPGMGSTGRRLPRRRDLPNAAGAGRLDVMVTPGVRRRFGAGAAASAVAGARICRVRP